MTQMLLPADHPIALAVVEAIHKGDIERLKTLLQETPELAVAHLGGEDKRCGMTMTRSLLHVATDWPGHFPNVADAIKVLIGHGADPNARFTGPHTETPLHWAASSDDVDAIDALLESGADMEARGAVIAGGTALSDATGFGQWNAARRLVERGARADRWEAATLGLMDRLEEIFAQGGDISKSDITSAFWGACHGGQRASAEYLLNRGADINWIGYDKLTPLDAARRSNADDVVAWLVTQGAKRAAELNASSAT